jgi:hypothetical protein
VSLEGAKGDQSAALTDVLTKVCQRRVEDAFALVPALLHDGPPPNLDVASHERNSPFRGGPARQITLRSRSVSSAHPQMLATLPPAADVTLRGLADIVNAATPPPGFQTEDLWLQRF